jgi:uncharacterized protein (TIGR00299 family) protein
MVEWMEVLLKVAFFDCFSGISGDMCLGALVDAGASFRELKERLKALPLDSYEIRKKTVIRRGMRATKIDIKTDDREQGRNLSDIRALIEGSDLQKRIKKRGMRIFRKLFQAEARVHGGRISDIHLHELSGTDCIIDIIGTLICLDNLGIDAVHSSPLNLGSGVISSAHGILPVPAPATSEILKGKPVYSSGIGKELTTPTGAAIISVISESFGSLPDMEIESIGYGAGGYQLKEQPNLLRVFIGRRDGSGDKGGGEEFRERLIVIETNIDDMNPQAYGYVMDKLLSEGALDVFLSTVIMKKSRPGILLSIICYPDLRDKLIKTLLRETTTLGVRYYETERLCLKREIKEVRSEFGPVRFKTVKTDKYSKSAPEFEDCRRIAESTGLPLIEVMRRLNRSGE